MILHSANATLQLIALRNRMHFLELLLLNKNLTLLNLEDDEPKKIEEIFVIQEILSAQILRYIK